MADARFDLVIAGGGLSAGLLALALRRARPELALAVVEAAPRFGGNHIWSSFASDLSPQGRALVEPLVAHRWPAHRVLFPGLERRVPGEYRSATSDRLHDALMAALPPGGRLVGVPVVEVGPDHVLLADQRRLQASAVVDARGQGLSPHLRLAAQKFVGLELELEAPHGLAEPIVMDATVEQLDGYRFVYCLPFTPTTLLVEDTYYTSGPALDEAALEARVLAYAAARGWRVARVLRRERGVLPIALDGDIDAHLAAFPPGVAPIGLAAGLFHPVTGYSLPDAATLALKLASLPRLGGAAIDRAVRDHARAMWASRGFYRLLNRMLFDAARPGQRWRVLRHFYTRPDAVVGRFYAGHSTAGDKLRILAGRPPVPLHRALKVLAS